MVRNCSRADRVVGSSRKASRPGTYGNRTGPCATADSIGSSVAVSSTTTAVATRPAASS
ncbi:Uncharacterised protein [Mycobacteroides abscessus subsp. abscessus]|nr:Uncharacterised protein [Mycobacteroides abscessus subsp. abscessus]